VYTSSWLQQCVRWPGRRLVHWCPPRTILDSSRSRPDHLCPLCLISQSRRYSQASSRRTSQAHRHWAGPRNSPALRPGLTPERKALPTTAKPPLISQGSVSDVAKHPSQKPSPSPGPSEIISAPSETVQVDALLSLTHDILHMTRTRSVLDDRRPTVALANTAFYPLQAAIR
jgi:hypothetical protein